MRSNTFDLQPIGKILDYSDENKTISSNEYILKKSIIFPKSLRSNTPLLDVRAPIEFK